MCCKWRSALSRLGVLWGLLAFIILLVAYINGPWLYTREPVMLPQPHSHLTTTIAFRIGFWRVCPSVRRLNNTSIHNPSPACSLVKYSGWTDLSPSDLGLWTNLDLAQIFITKMRCCTVLTGAALALILFALIIALIGQCNGDNKLIIACGLFILAGLCLGSGLVVFATALSETLLEIRQYHKDTSSSYEYKYGWCFYAAGTAFIFTKMAAVFTLTGHVNRFSSVDEMVREIVPGAERKLREHQRLSTEYLVKHSNPSPRHHRRLPECGPLLTKTPPDVCTDLTAAPISGVVELAGQTIPITVKNCSAPLPNKYGTMPLHQGWLGVADLGSSSSNSSGLGGCNMNARTLQHPKKKKVKIETFQTPDDVSFEFAPSRKVAGGDFSGVELRGKCCASVTYSGSAV